jgi:type VI secretion system VasD/TssJ family lipoprotein
MCINLLYRFLVTVVIGALCSCSSTKGAGKTDTISFQKEAISLTITSDKQLNLYNGSPHSLSLCVYQLSEPNGFIQLGDEKDGAGKLMGCNRFDASVAYTKRIVVHPGQEIVDVSDRAEGTRYIGIIAGFYDVKKDKIIQLLTIPAGIAKSNSKGLPLQLTLGSKGILSLKVKE